VVNDITLLNTLPELPAGALMVFTSQEGSRRAEQVLRFYLRFGPQPMPELLALAEATAKPLAGLAADFPWLQLTVANVHTAGGLGQWILHNRPAAHLVLHLCSTDSRPELRETLSEVGLDYQALPLYHPQPVRVPPDSLAGAAALLLLAPSQAEAFAQIFPHLPEGVPILTIGPTTERAARSAWPTALIYNTQAANLADMLRAAAGMLKHHSP
jgi:uroporphyrinogen-III synthase